MGTNPSSFAKTGFWKGEVAGLDTRRYPVETVSWEDAAEFCRKLSAWPAEKSAGRVYRLPTEAEWEYACRAGTGTAYYCGDGVRHRGDIAWYTGNAGEMTHPVGMKKPNAFGLFDMHGNVWEWCQDWYDEHYYRESPVVDPQGPTSACSHRVIRGGSWFHWGSCRSAVRDGVPPGSRYYYGYGFRVAVNPVDASGR
jgi:formylglycine-generating enzyme required for sulfatase activity